MDNIRHRWYKYKESFDPNIVVQAIKESKLDSSANLIDPFNGSGTVTLTASKHGYNSVGIEVNPFAAFLANTKALTPNIENFKAAKENVLQGAFKEAISPLLNYSTFSELGQNKKWLFNSPILNSFAGGWKASGDRSIEESHICQLALIGACMDNANAVRDGKCLKYKNNWEQLNYGKSSFLQSLEERFDIIQEDLEQTPLDSKAKIIAGDARKVLKDLDIKPFKLCVTSPPYLNSFDYTDLYRPELFLGKFINSNAELQLLRTKTVRSHVEIKIDIPLMDDFGLLYKEVFSEIKSKQHLLWDKQIPIMIQAYFEDMFKVFSLLRKKADPKADLWIVVSNSAYADTEIPVDLILGDIGCKAGWFLKEIDVLKYIKKRVSKYSPNIIDLRESVIKFSASK